MKNYPKTYEDVYTSEKSLRACQPWKIGTDNGMDKDEYQELFKKTIRKFQDDIFDGLVKIYWLRRRFAYNGRHRAKDYGNSVGPDRAYSVFVRNRIGYEPKTITVPEIFPRIISYFNDFFPEFFEKNPFEEEYKYPYKYVTIDFLGVVYQMEERLELLEQAEKEKMGYAEFLDYINNYINCYNEDVGYDHFVYLNDRWHTPHVSIMKKK